jgi:hypothetical protein
MDGIGQWMDQLMFGRRDDAEATKALTRHPIHVHDKRRGTDTLHVVPMRDLLMLPAGWIDAAISGFKWRAFGVLT